MAGGVQGIGAHCCCSDTCQVCLEVALCGSHHAAGVTIYDSTDGTCSGSIVSSGTYDGTTPLCLTVPTPGTYDVTIGGTGLTTCCTQITVATCGEFKTLRAMPATYTVVIRVVGCSNKIIDSELAPCPLEGVAVAYTDGTNTASGTTNSGGYVTFSGLSTPCDEPGYTITLSSMNTDCGWEATTHRYGTVGDGIKCGAGIQVTPDIRSGYVCTCVCNHPLKQSYTLDIYGQSVPMTWQGNFCGIDSNSVSVWTGCGSFHCDDAATPLNCGPVDDNRYQYGGATIPFKATLILGSLGSVGSPDAGCGPDLSFTLEIVAATVGSYCDPDASEQRLVGSEWVYGTHPGGGGTVTGWATVAIGCDYLYPGSFGPDTSSYTGSVITTAVVGIVAYDTANIACDCPLTRNASVAWPGGGAAPHCTGSSYALY